jgi:hypothetical protein
MSRATMDARDEILARFRTACEQDERVRAAFLGGSGGSGTADAWADIDLYLVIGDDDYDAFLDECYAFLDRLGRPVFRETLNIGFDVVAFIIDSGVDGELLLHRVSMLDDLQAGPIRLLIDRAGLAGRDFPHGYPAGADVAEDLRVALNWFWRDTLHFIRAIARGRSWTAYGFLEKLRGGCQYLIVQAESETTPRRDHFVPFDGYEALDHIPESGELEMLRESVCPVERDAMLRSARTLIRICERLGPALADQHRVGYPAEAATVVLRQMDALETTWSAISLIPPQSAH